VRLGCVFGVSGIFVSLSSAWQILNQSELDEVAVTLNRVLNMNRTQGISVPQGA